MQIEIVANRTVEHLRKRLVYNCSIEEAHELPKNLKATKFDKKRKCFGGGRKVQTPGRFLHVQMCRVFRRKAVTINDVSYNKLLRSSCNCESSSFNLLLSRRGGELRSSGQQFHLGQIVPEAVEHPKLRDP